MSAAPRHAGSQKSGEASTQPMNVPHQGPGRNGVQRLSLSAPAVTGLRAASPTPPGRAVDSRHASARRLQPSCEARTRAGCRVPCMLAPVPGPRHVDCDEPQRIGVYTLGARVERCALPTPPPDRCAFRACVASRAPPFQSASEPGRANAVNEPNQDAARAGHQNEPFFQGDAPLGRDRAVLLRLGFRAQRGQVAAGAGGARLSAVDGLCAGTACARTHGPAQRARLGGDRVSLAGAVHDAGGGACHADHAVGG